MEGVRGGVCVGVAGVEGVEDIVRFGGGGSFFGSLGGGGAQGVVSDWLEGMTSEKDGVKAEFVSYEYKRNEVYEM
jgi:hypothetical protein